MNESAAKFAHQNRRQPIDLDAFEQRLRGDQPRAGAPDPLAELAMLVDSAHDPAGRLFANAPGQPGNPYPVRNQHAAAPGGSPSGDFDSAGAPAMLRGYARQMRAPQAGPYGRAWPVDDYGQPAGYANPAGPHTEQFAQPQTSAPDAGNGYEQDWREAPGAYDANPQAADPQAADPQIVDPQIVDPQVVDPYAPAAGAGGPDAYTGWNPGEWTVDAFQPRSTIPPESGPQMSDHHADARQAGHPQSFGSGHANACDAMPGAPARSASARSAPARSMNTSMNTSMPRAIGLSSPDDDPVDAFERSVAHLVAARAAAHASPAPDYRAGGYADPAPHDAHTETWVQDPAGAPAQERPLWQYHDEPPAAAYAHPAPSYDRPGHDNWQAGETPSAGDFQAEGAQRPFAPAYAEAPPPRSRKPIYLTGAAMAVLVLGIGVTLATRGSMSGSGDVPVIAAASDPLKVRAPESESGTGRQARNISILQGNATQPQQSNIVTRDEQPIDLSSVPTEPRRELRLREEELSRKLNLADRNMQVPIAGVAPEVEAPRATNGYFPEPRRVRTIMVRADGSLINPASGEPARRGAAGPLTTASTARPGAAAEVPPSRPVAAQPKIEARVAPNARPAPGPRVAAADRQPASPPAAAASTPVAGGDFAVQLSAPPTESAARTAATRLGRQYAQALGGRTPTVERAVVNNRTVWRIRVTGLERSDAVTMCTRVQGAGGQCFVARN